MSDHSFVHRLRQREMQKSQVNAYSNFPGEIEVGTNRLLPQVNTLPTQQNRPRMGQQRQRSVPANANIVA